MKPDPAALHPVGHAGFNPVPVAEKIPPEDLADARANHRDAWGPEHDLERGKSRANSNAYSCRAVGCSTVYVVVDDE